MTEKPLKSLKDANYPLEKPDVIANAVSENVKEECVEKLYEELPDDKVYRNLKDIKKNLPQDDKPVDSE